MKSAITKDSRAARRGSGTRNSVQRRNVVAEEKRGKKTSRRGFAAMDTALRRRIARQGGLTVSRNRKHMAEIGRIGGERSHRGGKR